MRALLTAYGRVLRDRELRRLLAGEFVSGVGDWLYLVAILVILYERTRDPLLLGVVAAARVLPYVVLSVPAGIAADRFDRRAVLLVTDVSRGLLMLVLAALVAIEADVALIVGGAIAATCFSAFFGPAIGAYLPSLVKDESDLGPANTAYATLNEVTYILGPALAALIIASFDLALAFLLNAISFGVVALVLWTLPSSRARRTTHRRCAATDGDPEEPAGKTAPDTAPAEAAEADTAPDDTAPEGAAPEGAAAALSRPRWRQIARPLSGLSVVDAASSFVFGGVGVLTVIIAYERLGAGEAGTGALNAAMGVGGLAGSLVTGVLVLRRRLAPPLLGGAAVLGLGVAALGWGSSLALAMLAIAAAAAGALLLEVISTTLIQRIAPDEVRGRAFGALQSIDVLAFAAGSLLIPALGGAIGLGPVLLACGIGVMALAVVAVALLGDWATRAPAADTERATLAAVPMLAGLAPGRLETAERRAVPMPMRAGQVLIAQGEEADRFYVIVDGRVEVTQRVGEEAAPRVLRQMGEGEGFGEIGLLTGVPRTATVTALTDGRLLALDKEDFLDLVGDAGAATFPLVDPYLGRAPAGGLEPAAERSR